MSSSIRLLNEGVQAVQSGRLEDGARMLRAALHDENIQGQLRATALVWLAETVHNAFDQMTLYEQALEAAPDLEYAQRRLANLLAHPATPRPVPAPIPDAAPPPEPVYQPPAARRTPPPPPTTLPEAQPTPPTTLPQQTYETLGILAGTRRGSGFFINDQGLIVTTRTVTGNLEHLTIELEPDRQLNGRVIRAFPIRDVAFIHVPYRPTNLLNFSPYSDIPTNTALQIRPYQQEVIRAHRRETGRMMASHLFPTDITRIPDAGGAPVFNEQGQVVGMITHNISSASAHLYGVQIAAIRQALDIYLQEMQQQPDRIYCTSCGAASIAAAAGGDYCEVCGSVMPLSQEITRVFRPDMVSYYERNEAPACAICGARAGFHEQRCLRCGQIGDPTRGLVRSISQ